MPQTSAQSGPERVVVVRVITRLNIGGPSIQATRLTTALEPHGFTTRLLHGRLGDGEGDMSYLIAPGADAAFIPELRRPLSPFHDYRAFVRLYDEIARARPAIVHTHMAKAGLLGRLAAALYNFTRGSAPRARVVHTYHGHVLDGYFSAAKTRLFTRSSAVWPASPIALLPSRRTSAGSCSMTTRSADRTSTRWCRWDSICPGSRRLTGATGRRRAARSVSTRRRTWSPLSAG